MTSQVITRAFDRMRHLIDNSLAEIRLRGKIKIECTPIRLIDIVSEVEATAVLVGKSKEIHLEISADPSIELFADRHLIFSAVSNLVNNAFKFTKRRGQVWLRTRKSANRILVEVEDECGGLPNGKAEDLFTPFVKKGENKTGMGLGLPLSRQAIELNGGTLTVKDLPKKGCIFTISLPINAVVERAAPADEITPSLSVT